MHACVELMLAVFDSAWKMPACACLVLCDTIVGMCVWYWIFVLELLGLLGVYISICSGAYSQFRANTVKRFRVLVVQP